MAYMHSKDAVDGFFLESLSEVYRVDGVYRRWVKRILDIVLSLAALCIVLPLVLVLAGYIALRQGRPFYIQDRIGREGRVYRLVKLRTMVPDADARLETYLAACPEARREWDLTKKLKRDPRVTPIGRVLRKFSLDELPQFWNVLCGDMSLVGPRPMMLPQVAEYEGRAYFQLRPGITGTWQVRGRNETTFADRARYDDAYDRDLCLLGDLRLLVETVFVVIKGTGY